MSFEVNFLKVFEEIQKNTLLGLFNEILTEIVKNFGVHIFILQRTAGDQYQGGANLAPPAISALGHLRNWC